MKQQPQLPLRVVINYMWKTKIMFNFHTKWVQNLQEKNWNLQARLDLIEFDLAVELSVMLTLPECFIHALLVPNVRMSGHVQEERRAALSSGQTASLQLCKAKSRNCIHEGYKTQGLPTTAPGTISPPGEIVKCSSKINS